MKTMNIAISDILIWLFAFCVLAGFLFPYSIFSFACPFLFALWAVGASINAISASKFISAKDATKKLREEWQPCTKLLPIEQEVFAYKLSNSTKFFIIPTISLFLICGIMTLAHGVTNKVGIAIALGVWMILVWLLMMAIYCHPIRDRIIAKKEKLTFDRFFNKVDIPWGEILSMQRMTVWDTEFCKVCTTKKSCDFSSNFEGYTRLTELIGMALETNAAASDERTA